MASYDNHAGGRSCPTQVHAAAWQEMFGSFLRQRAQQTGEQLVPFDSAHVD